MKNLKVITILFAFSILIFSCQSPGMTTKKLDGDENLLPEELRGLRVYNVSLNDGNSVKVAILNNELNSITGIKGKRNESTIILNTETRNTIEVKEILMENDTLIIFRK